MCPSDISSEPGRPAGVRSRSAGLLGAIGILILLVAPSGASGQVRMTQAEALATVFPDTSAMERRTAYLSQDQTDRARELAGSSVPVDGTVVTHYVGLSTEGEAAVAYFDAHRVRTHPEVLMIVVGPDDAVRRVEVLKFSEPREYLPPEGWLEQFQDRSLAEDLSPRGDIAGITGATLTARAVSRAVRRTLALHRVISPLDSLGVDADGRGADGGGGA